jgi:hypothetical protein
MRSACRGFLVAKVTAMRDSLYHTAPALVRLRDHAAHLLKQAQADYDAGNASQTTQSLAAIRLSYQQLQQRLDQLNCTLSR